MILLVDFIFARRDICNFIQVKIRFTLQAPICSFDAKNAVWANDGNQKIKAVIAGKWTAKFPINREKAIEIVKNLRKQELVVEFEKTRK